VPFWLTTVSKAPLAAMVVMSTTAETVKLLPGAVSRTGPDP